MYKNLKIGQKLLIGFASVALISTLIMVFMLLCLRNVGTLSHDMFTGPYVSTTEAMGIRRDLNSLGKDVRSAILSKDLPTYKKSMVATKAGMEERILKLKTSFGGDKQLITNIETAMAGLVAERDKVFAAIEANDYDKATDIVLTTYFAAFNKSADAASALYNDADQRAITFDKTSQTTVNITMLIAIIALAVCIVVACIMAVVSTRSITAPMKKVEHAMDEMAKGIFSVEIDYESKDEMGILAQRMRFVSTSISSIVKDIGYLLGEMANGNFDINSKSADTYIGDYAPIIASIKNINDKLSDTLSQINQASNQVSSGSDQVSSGAQALSQGATEQASSVQELAATISEISTQIQNNAKNAREASLKTNQAGDDVATSNKMMQELIAAMSEISTSSNEIGKVIKAIEDIAFQTNILALNAAVEAARAGSAGKGFAVVADEVRNLASKSAEAAKGTTALIEGSINAVGKGTRLADDTAKSLLSVVEGTKSAASIVDMIASASSEQASSIAQVTMGIDQISSVVQTNSATAEQSAAASEELSGQSQLLKELVGFFRLKNSHITATSKARKHVAASYTQPEVIFNSSNKY